MMKKRVTAGILITLLCCLIAAGCGKSNDLSQVSSAETTQAVSESPAETAGDDSDGTDSEVYEEALKCYETIMAAGEDARYDTFIEAQSAYNYDENNERYFVDPDTAANLPSELNEAVLSLGEYEIGLSEESDYGWFIVMRLPFDADELTDIKNDYINVLFNEVLDEAVSGAVVEETETLEDIDFTAYMEALSSLQSLIKETYSELGEEIGDALELEEALLEKLPQEAKEDCTSYLTDGAVSGDWAVMLVNGEEVTADVLFYFLNYEKGIQFGSSDVSETYLAALLNQAKKDAVQYTVAGRLGRDCGRELTEDEISSVDEVLNNTLESSLIYLGSGPRALETILTDTVYGNSYASYLYGEDGAVDISDDEVEEYGTEQGYYSCLYIWFYELSET